MKKKGVLLHTKSTMPSSVYSLIAKPLGSRSVSEKPFSPRVVENLTQIGVCFPIPFKNFALVYLETS